MTSRPNILWFSTHDINPHLGAYEGVWPGAEDACTPRLDQLAREGARFDAAFAAAPVCAPSRSAIMTGCHPIAIGTMHMRTRATPPPEVRIFTEYLRAAGYYASNNWFTDFQLEVPPTAFDDCSRTGHWRNRPSADTPFFAAFHSMITHESMIYLDEDQFHATTSHVRTEDRHNPDDVALPPYYPDTSTFRVAWARYLDLITEMDQWVGNILDELEEDGLAENTIVVFWSDHGLGMPRAKRWAHESGLREPLIIRWPERIAPGTVRSELVQLLDLGPTMLTAAGLPVPEHMHGKPIFDESGVFLEQNEFAFGSRDRMMDDEDMSRTVRDSRFRYIRHLRHDHPEMSFQQYPDQFPTWSEFRRLRYEEFTQIGHGEMPTRLTPLQRSVVANFKPAEELYDIVEDPHETRNLAADPQYANQLNRLRRALDEWIATCGDLGLVPEEDLIESWRPGGRLRPTEAPTVRRGAEGIVATCATAGASIGWTDQCPPHEEQADASLPTWSPRHFQGSEPNHHWHLYSGPIEDPGVPVWFRAWRLGYEPSSVVSIS